MRSQILSNIRTSDMKKGNELLMQLRPRLELDNTTLIVELRLKSRAVAVDDATEEFQTDNGGDN